MKTPLLIVFYAGLCLLLCVAVNSGCAKRPISTTTIVDEGPDQTSSTQSSINLFTDDEEELLLLGSRLSSKGKFDESVEVYESVYSMTSAKPEYRAEAMFRLGNAYLNFLNPKKSYIKALSYFQRMIAEFPDSDLRPRAEEAVEKIVALQEGADHSTSP